MDSNILIDYLNGFAQAGVTIRSHSDRAISLVSKIEVLAGVPENGRAAAGSLISNFSVIGITDEIAAEAVEVRRSTRLKLADAIILATARVERRVVLTRNTRDFKPGRDVRVPYML